jgi:RNA polymerase sigma factor (sigma-70 family)
MGEDVAAVRARENRGVSARDADADTVDLHIMRRVAQGDRQALTDLYLRHGQALFQYLQHLTDDRYVAEELLQDTLVAAWKNALTYRAEGSTRAWLFGIARRRAYKRLRQSEPLRADPAELEDLPAPDPEPESALLAGITRDEIAGALLRLLPIHREVLLLTFVNDLSYAETAGILGVPVGTVKSRLSNARRTMRTLLGAELGPQEKREDEEEEEVDR